VANIFWTISTKFYQNRSGFIDDVTKNIWCVFGFAVLIASTVHLQNTNAMFHQVVKPGEQENNGTTVSQIYSRQCIPNLSESTGFCGRCDKNILGVFLRFTVYSCRLCIKLYVVPL